MTYKRPPGYHREWYRKNKERVRKNANAWRAKNKDRINAHARETYPEWKEKSNTQSKRWYARNKERRREYTKKYRENNKGLFAWYKDEERFGGNKEVVFQLDGYVCRLCGVSISNNNKPLVVHHIDGSGGLKSVNNKIENLITLCNRCHQHTHRHQKKNRYVCQSREDIVRTMAKVIEEYRNIHPLPRRKSNI